MSEGQAGGISRFSYSVVGHCSTLGLRSDSGCTLRGRRRCNRRHMILFMLATPPPAGVFPFRGRRHWDGKWTTSRYKAELRRHRDDVRRMGNYRPAGNAPALRRGRFRRGARRLSTPVEYCTGVAAENCTLDAQRRARVLRFEPTGSTAQGSDCIARTNYRPMMPCRLGFCSSRSTLPCARARSSPIRNFPLPFCFA